MDTKVVNATEANWEKVDKNYTEVMAVQPKEASNANTWATTKTMSDKGLNIQRSVRIQGLSENPVSGEYPVVVSSGTVGNIEGLGPSL